MLLNQASKATLFSLSFMKYHYRDSFNVVSANLLTDQITECFIDADIDAILTCCTSNVEVRWGVYTEGDSTISEVPLPHQQLCRLDLCRFSAVLARPSSSPDLTSLNQVTHAMAPCIPHSLDCGGFAQHDGLTSSVAGGMRGQ